MTKAKRSIHGWIMLDEKGSPFTWVLYKTKLEAFNNLPSPAWVSIGFYAVRATLTVDAKQKGKSK